VPLRGQLVLVGSGHAHLHVVRHARELLRRGVAPVLVDPGSFWYSGLATGMLAGMHGCHEDRIDPRPLIENQGGRFLRDRVTGLDRAGRRVLLESGAVLEYDAVSFNVGSEVAWSTPLPASDRIYEVKPIRNLWRLRTDLEQRFREDPGSPPRVVVIGGGATGCEVTASIEALAWRRRAALHLTLIGAADHLLPGHPRAATLRITGVLRRRGVELQLSTSIRAIDPEAATAADGRRLQYDHLVLATGLRPPAWLRDLGLPLDGQGALLLDATLRSVGDERVFGAGDCVRIEGHDLPRLGVFGVRQAPILLSNLLRRRSGEPPLTYRPQKRWLSILNLGHGDALATRGRFTWHGRSSLWLKEFLDRRFLDRYRCAVAATGIH